MSDDADGGAGDSVEVVTERCWLGRLAGSLIAVPFGVVLFLAGFVRLDWYQGRAVAALDRPNADARRGGALSRRRAWSP